nr:GNAT family N-acetyltransferase [Halobacillus sp. A5]
MRGLKKEIGAPYLQSCLTAYENEQAIGIIMPHIEPGTKEEGRLFYFGVLPEFRRQGRGRELHHLALTKLRKEFGASDYIGATSHNNTPMLRIFEANGCNLKAKRNLFKKTRLIN